LSTPFQNRLVGTIIVAAAAVIFLPDILDGEKQSFQTQFEEIPKAPAFVAEATPEPFSDTQVIQLRNPQLADDKPLDDQGFDLEQEQETKTDATVVELAVLEPVSDFAEKQLAAEVTTQAETQTNSQDSWVIQLGSFRHQKNVDALVKKLQNSGYLTYTRPVKTSSGTLIKVFVGPDTDKLGLAAKIPDLKKLTSVNGRLAKFAPATH
jgi:DedD protein